MWKIKGCTRCGGDLFLDWDLEGFYDHCLQCGYAGNLESIDEFRREKEAKEEKEKQPIRL